MADMRVMADVRGQRRWTRCNEWESDRWATCGGWKAAVALVADKSASLTRGDGGGRQEVTT